MAYSPPFNEPKAREEREDDSGLTETENKGGEPTMARGGCSNPTMVAKLRVARLRALREGESLL